MEINLLEKTELWIEDIDLENADLNRIAAVAADVLGIDPTKVLVVDVLDHRITLDLLQQTLQAEQVYGKKAELLRRLGEISGVHVTDQTDIHSDGILGMIALDESEAREVISRSAAMAAEVMTRVARRACVFPTGFELRRGMIQDTNTPFIKNALEERGFQVACGDVLDDDKDVIRGKIQLAIDQGYGLIVTTGGVGAESKDRTVEAVLALDPEAETPYIIHFTQGTGRHEKDGVRIAVGSVGPTTIVCLPGPNDEVRIGMPVILEAIENGRTKAELASALANALRMKLQYHRMEKGDGHGTAGHPDHRR
jgi:molybdenum cofactor synthesis domain-containing protein